MLNRTLIWQGAWPVMRMIAGFIVWAVCFVVLYAGMSLACAYAAPATGGTGPYGINALLAGLWVLHLAPLGWLTWHSWRQCRRQAPSATPAVRFVLHASWVANLAAFFSTVWVGFPVLVTPSCV